MNLRNKIKAFLLLGKKVRVPRVEQPDIIGEIWSIDKTGQCRLTGGYICYINNVKRIK